MTQFPDSPDLNGEDPDDDNDPLSEEGALLVGAVGRFTKLARRIPWFLAVGLPVEDDLVDLARDYLDGSGFPDADIAPVEDWEEAAEAATTTDWNSPWWEAEEQLLAALTDEAVSRVGEHDFGLAMDHLRAQIAEPILSAAEEAARTGGVADEDLIRAAAGAAVQACYQAALVLMTEGGGDHPFALKFQLFEAGRWPLGVTGSSFNLF